MCSALSISLSLSSKLILYAFYDGWMLDDWMILVYIHVALVRLTESFLLFGAVHCALSRVDNSSSSSCCCCCCVHCMHTLYVVLLYQ